MSSGGWSNEHIVRVKWVSDQDGEVGESTREAFVDWIDNRDGYTYVQGPQSRSQVGVVRENPPYLRTHANGIWNGNLLAWPTL